MKNKEKNKKLKKCDMCGESFVGKTFPVYDENHNKQSGLIQCEDCSIGIVNNFRKR